MLPPFNNSNIIQPLIFINDEEIWLPINNPKLKEIYYVSSHGRIFSNGYINFSQQKDKILSYEISNTGYYRVHLVHKDGTAHHYSIHRLVLETFFPVENMNNLFVNHKDGNKLNNHLCNLEWTSAEENTRHAILNQFVNWRTGNECSWSTITSEIADQIAYMITLRYSHIDICKMLNVTKAIVANIANGISWRDSYEKYQLWRYRKSIKKVFTDEQEKEIQTYISNNIYKYDSKYYRALCMDICKDILHVKINRTLYIEIMNYIYKYLYIKKLSE